MQKAGRYCRPAFFVYILSYLQFLQYYKLFVNNKMFFISYLTIYRNISYITILNHLNPYSNENF